MDQPPCERTQQIKKVRRLFGVLSVFFIAVSQVLLFTTPVDASVIAPRSFWIGLLGVALLILSQVVPIPNQVLRITRVKAPPAFAPILASVLLALLTTFTMVSFQKFERANYMPVLTLWAMSALLYLSAFPLPHVSKNRFLAWVKTHRGELLALLAIILLASGLRFYQLGSIPRVINGDEGMIGLTAQSTTNGELANPFMLFHNMGGLYLQVLNLFIALFHASAFSIRLPSAIGGILSILATYPLSRMIFGNRVALLTAVLIAISHTHLHFSRTLTGYIQDTWLIPLEMFFLLNGLENRRSWQTALSGMLLALHFSYYLTAPPVVAIILGYMIFCFVFHRRWFQTVLPQVGAFWGGLLILLLPSLYRYLTSPDELMARLSMDGTFQSGWLASQVAQTGQTAAQILLSRVSHAFLSLIHYPSIDFYGSPVPMLGMIASLMFLVGLAYALLKIRQRPVLLILTVFWGFILMIGLFAIPPSADSYRVVVVLPFAMMLAGLGIDQLFTLFGLTWRVHPVRYLSVCGVLLGLLFVTNMLTYFGEFAGRCQFGGDQASRFASYLGSFVGTLDRSTSVYLLRDENIFYGSHPSVDFLSDRHPITNIEEPVEGRTFPRDEVIIASPNRIKELEAWINAHPGGKVHYRYDCRNTILLGYQAP